ncbi:male gametophyte-specific2 [Zea mays]|uniref:Male gametophyte-specific2 n=1 Tax=Zea mays TaxID=4577 RepID=A0A1D6QQI2_MAIZE|nr:male gametophyte-specific2 [Zea mays]
METTTKLRWSRPGSFLLVAAAFLASAAASGVNVGQFDDHLQKRKELAEASAREAYRPDPYNVTNSFNAAVHRAVSSSRREMRERPRKHKKRGPCRATNPIDKCWRCRRDWATDRQRLARCARHAALGRHPARPAVDHLRAVHDHPALAGAAHEQRQDHRRARRAGAHRQRRRDHGAAGAKRHHPQPARARRQAHHGRPHARLPHAHRLPHQGRRRRHLPLLRHQRLDRPHLHVQLRGRPHRRRAELHGDHHLQLPLHQPQRRHALRRQRLLAAGPDHADHRRLQPLRQGPGAADAKVPLGLLPRCQQRLHALAHVRHWRRRRANHHQPGQPLHSTTKHRRQSDHQALRGRRRVEELGVAHGGRPVHERRHLQSVRRRPQAGRHQRVGQAQARNLRYKAHPLLRHTVLLHGQAVLKAGRWASEAASSSSWPGHARSRWLRFISWKKARMDHRLSFC